MIAIIVILILGIILILYNVFHDKLIFLSVKLDNIEEKIKSTLIKRKELIKEAEDIIRDTLNIKKEIFDGFNQIDSKINIMELDRKLLIYVSELNLIKDKYDELNSNEDFQKVSFSLTETEDLLNAYKEYYNENASKYNKSIKSFPLIFTTLIKRRKEKLFFDNKSMNDEDYNDFKY